LNSTRFALPARRRMRKGLQTASGHCICCGVCPSAPCERVRMCMTAESHQHPRGQCMRGSVHKLAGMKPQRNVLEHTALKPGSRSALPGRTVGQAREYRCDHARCFTWSAQSAQNWSVRDIQAHCSLGLCKDFDWVALYHAGVWSISKALCKARTASSMYFSSITTEVLISLVEII
jgi:hypothetical protein